MTDHARDTEPLSAASGGVSRQLGKLIEEWRAEALDIKQLEDPDSRDWSTIMTLEDCADELEAALVRDPPAWHPDLDTREFYEVMQAYRHASALRPAEVVEAFEAVKAWLRASPGQAPPQTDDEGLKPNAEFKQVKDWIPRAPEPRHD